MVLNETFRLFNLTFNFYGNDSKVEIDDYYYNRTEIMEPESVETSTPYSKTLNSLLGLIIKGTLNSPRSSYDNDQANDYGINSTLPNATEFAGYNPTFQNNLLLFILCFFCFATVFGNVLVMIAVIREPYLHTVTNYFIASLAIADLIVGTIVMPFCVILEVTNGYWPFGQDFCDIWRSIDVLASTASILNLCVIAVDRKWAITKSMKYPDVFSPKYAALMITAVWLCSSLISFPAIVWWRAVAKGPPLPNQCLFTDDPGYLISSSVVSFYGPLFIMLMNYYKLYSAAQMQKKSLRLGTKQIHSNGGSNISLTLRMHRGGKSNSESYLQNGGHLQAQAHAQAQAQAQARAQAQAQAQAQAPDQDQDQDHAQANEDMNECSTLRVPARQIKSFSLSRKITKLAKEKKAAKTLGIVMGVFIVCWLPFFICNVLIGICGEKCFSDMKTVSSVVTWLGWSNSAMNPVIYVLWNRDFRRAFNKLLCRCCPKFIQRRHTYRNRFRQIYRDDYALPHFHAAGHHSAPPSIMKDINL